MAETFSNMIPLGTIAPDFLLSDTISGRSFSLTDLKGDKATVLMFICNHCPYVIHVLDVLINIPKNYTDKGISFIAISSNDVNSHPQDSPENMKKLAERYGFTFPYLFDSTQETARSYSAACTPDFFIFNNVMELVYRGQLDDSRPGNNIPVTGRDLRNALDNILDGKSVDPVQRPSIGCNIKWRI
ncbi:MAG: thioredoxin family protein [Acidobacteriota bacterium]